MVIEVACIHCGYEAEVSVLHPNVDKDNPPEIRIVCAACAAGTPRKEVRSKDESDKE